MSDVDAEWARIRGRIVDGFNAIKLNLSHRTAESFLDVCERQFRKGYERNLGTDADWEGWGDAQFWKAVEEELADAINYLARMYSCMDQKIGY